MTPIHQLFSRIRWDTAYAAADFVVGYYDRLADRVIRVPFARIHFEPDDHFAFLLFDEDGGCRRIPFHRVREVRRNGEVIWRRPD